MKTFHMAAEVTAGDKGRVRARVAAPGVKMEVGDDLPHVVTSGAFVASLAKPGAEVVPLCWQHNWTGGGLPIGHATASDGTGGLVLDGQLNLSTDGGRAVFDGIKAKAIREWSIGYRVTEYEDRDGVRYVLKAELLE